jgi:hypothetical protein
MAGGYALFALNAPTAWGDNLFSLSSVTRTPGLLGYFKLNVTNAFDGIVGYMANQTAPTAATDTDLEAAIYFAETGSTAYWGYDTINRSIGTYSTSDTDYTIALRAAGGLLFVGNKLRYIAFDNSTATLYPSAANAGKGFQVNSIRVPKNLWLPSPTASDGFGSAGALSTTDGQGHAETTGLGAGGSGVTWTGVYYSSGSAAYVTNLTATDTANVTNGTFETGDPPASWTASATATLSAETSAPYAGSQSLKLAKNGGSPFYAEQNQVTTNGYWYKYSAYGKRVDAGAFSLYIGTKESGTLYTETSYRLIKGSFAQATSPVTFKLGGVSGAGSDGVYVVFDNVKQEQLTTSELISSVVSSSAYSYVGCDYTRDVSNPLLVGGICGNIDSESNPQNYWIITYVYNAIYLYQYISGVQSSLFASSSTYSAGARIEAITYLDGTDMKILVFYNKTYVNGATLNAALKTNTKFGIFSTDDALRFDNFVVRPTGEAGEYSTLSKY